MAGELPVAFRTLQLSLRGNPWGHVYFINFLLLFYRNTPMLASGIKGMRIQLRFGSELPGSVFMRRRLGCPVSLLRGAPPPFHSVFQ
jgi:hypothetical protein